MSGVLLPRRPGRVTAQTASGIVLALLQLSAFWFVVHLLSDAITIHPIAILLFPITGALFLAMFLPVIVFLTLESDFSRLNPLNPVHYFKITWMTYKALGSNNWKVRIN